MLVQYFRRVGIDCGCFGVGEALSAKTLARDGLLLTGALVLVGLTWRQGRQPVRRFEDSRIRGLKNA
jgi:hypothetical protein